MLWRMAGAALGRGVLSIQDIAGLGVIKPRVRRVPVHHGEFLAIVVGVALDARRSRRSVLGVRCVEPGVRAQFRSNLLVAFQTAKIDRPCRNCVALRAIGWTVQALVGLGEWAGRDLPMGRQAKKNQKKSSKDPG
jgi:hypothetical protein